VAIDIRTVGDPAISRRVESRIWRHLNPTAMFQHESHSQFREKEMEAKLTAA
jgi:hypothetical protein